MQSITIPNVRITFPEFRQIQQVYLVRQRWWLVPLALLYPLYSIWGGNDGDFVTTRKLVATLFITAVVLGATIYGARSALRRMFEQTPFFQHPTTFRLDDSGIHFSNAIMSSEAAWTTVRSARQFGKWYVVTNKNRQGYLLDSSLIQSPATEQDLRVLLQQHGVTIR